MKHIQWNTLYTLLQINVVQETNIIRLNLRFSQYIYVHVRHEKLLIGLTDDPWV